MHKTKQTTEMPYIRPHNWYDRGYLLDTHAGFLSHELFNVRKTLPVQQEILDSVNKLKKEMGILFLNAIWDNLPPAAVDSDVLNAKSYANKVAARLGAQRYSPKSIPVGRPLVTPKCKYYCMAERSKKVGELFHNSELEPRFRNAMRGCAVEIDGDRVKLKAYVLNKARTMRFAAQAQEKKDLRDENEIIRLKTGLHHYRERVEFYAMHLQNPGLAEENRTLYQPLYNDACQQIVLFAKALDEAQNITALVALEPREHELTFTPMNELRRDIKSLDPDNADEYDKFLDIIEGSFKVVTFGSYAERHNGQQYSDIDGVLFLKENYDRAVVGGGRVTATDEALMAEIYNKAFEADYTNWDTDNRELFSRAAKTFRNLKEHLKAQDGLMNPATDHFDENILKVKYKKLEFTFSIHVLATEIVKSEITRDMSDEQERELNTYFTYLDKIKQAIQRQTEYWGHQGTLRYNKLASKYEGYHVYWHLRHKHDTPEGTIHAETILKYTLTLKACGALQQILRGSDLTWTKGPDETNPYALSEHYHPYRHFPYIDRLFPKEYFKREHWPNLGKCTYGELFENGGQRKVVPRATKLYGLQCLANAILEGILFVAYKETLRVTPWPPRSLIPLDYACFKLVEEFNLKHKDSKITNEQFLLLLKHAFNVKQLTK